MSLDMAHVVITGHLGKDPETRQAGSSTVVEFSLAVNDGTKEKPHTSWFSVQAWNKAGELAATYLRKGHQATVIGSIHDNNWEKDGVTHRDKRVRAATVFFGAKPKDKDEAAPSGASSATKPATDEEVPF